MRRLSLVGRVTLLSSIVAVLVGVMFAAALITIVSLRRSEVSESKAKDVTVATLRVQTLSVDLESALRGYVLSRNRHFLALYNQALRDLPVEIGRAHV